VQLSPLALLTVTVKLQVAGWAFDVSVAVQVTVVVPSGNNEPEAGAQVTVTQLPVVVGAG
jgi:hypothetical protein